MDTQRPEDLLGRTVVDPSGEKIGTATELYLPPAASGAAAEPPAGWVAVRTGVFGDHVSPVPLLGAEVDAGGRLGVGYPKRLVTGAPHHDASMALSFEEEVALFEHYAMDLPARRRTSVTAHAGDVPAPGHALTEDALGDSQGLHEGAGQATRLHPPAEDERRHDVSGASSAIYPDDALAETLAKDVAERERVNRARRAEGR